MNERQIRSSFEQLNAIISDIHVVYSKKEDGWYHGSEYVNKDAIYPFPRFLAPLCKEMAEGFSRKFEVVVGPTLGGVSLSQWTAFYASPFHHQREVMAVFAEEEDIIEHYETEEMRLSSFINNCTYHANGMVRIIASDKSKLVLQYECKTGTRRILKRGYEDLVAGRECLIVEDVIHTGETVKKTVRAVKQAGGIVMGVAALCNRSGGKVTARTLDVPKLKSLLNLKMKMYKEEECPLCEKYGVESVRTDIGHGKEFLFRIGKPMRP